AKKGETVLNLRQVSLVCPKELADITVAMGLTEVRAEDLGANMVLEGIPHLTALPTGTYFEFPSGAVLCSTAENLPCMTAGREIERRNTEKHGLLKRMVNTMGFPKTALHK